MNGLAQKRSSLAVWCSLHRAGLAAIKAGFGRLEVDFLLSRFRKQASPALPGAYSALTAGSKIVLITAICFTIDVLSSSCTWRSFSRYRVAKSLWRFDLFVALAVANDPIVAAYTRQTSGGQP
jgi:hypothetical protein